MVDLVPPADMLMMVNVAGFAGHIPAILLFIDKCKQTKTSYQHSWCLDGLILCCFAGLTLNLPSKTATSISCFLAGYFCREPCQNLGMIKYVMADQYNSVT